MNPTRLVMEIEEIFDHYAPILAKRERARASLYGRDPLIGARFGKAASAHYAKIADLQSAMLDHYVGRSEEDTGGVDDSDRGPDAVVEKVGDATDAEFAALKMRASRGDADALGQLDAIGRAAIAACLRRGARWGIPR